jgi:hypothetical protein
MSTHRFCPERLEKPTDGHNQNVVGRPAQRTFPGQILAQPNETSAFSLFGELLIHNGGRVRPNWRLE